MYIITFSIFQAIPHYIILFFETIIFIYKFLHYKLYSSEEAIERREYIKEQYWNMEFLLLVYKYIIVYTYMILIIVSLFLVTNVSVW